MKNKKFVHMSTDHQVFTIYLILLTMDCDRKKKSYNIHSIN